MMHEHWAPFGAWTIIPIINRLEVLFGRPDMALTIWCTKKRDYSILGSNEKCISQRVVYLP